MPAEVTGRVIGQVTGHQSALKSGGAWGTWWAARTAFLAAAAADQPWVWKGGPPTSPWQGRWTVFWNNPLGPQTPAEYAVIAALNNYNRAVDAVLALGTQGDDSPGGADVGPPSLPGGRMAAGDGAPLQDELLNQSPAFLPVTGLTLADELAGVSRGRQPQVGDGVVAPLGDQVWQQSQGGTLAPENEEISDVGLQ